MYQKHRAKNIKKFWGCWPRKCGIIHWVYFNVIDIGFQVTRCCRTICVQGLHTHFLSQQQDLENTFNGWTGDLAHLTVLRESLSCYISAEDLSVLQERIELLHRQWDEICHQVPWRIVWTILQAVHCCWWLFLNVDYFNLKLFPMNVQWV